MSGPELQLNFGAAEPLRLPFDGDRFRSFHAGPAPLSDVSQAALTALTQPVDFPPLAAMCVPGDRVVIVLDRLLPSVDIILEHVLRLLQTAGVEADHLTFLQPARLPSWLPPDLKAAVPNPWRDAVTWKIHDPTHADHTGYLATSVSGERIYLARDLLDADVVVPLFRAGFDTIAGYRSPGGLLYPWLSHAEAFQKTLGEGHPELRPDSDRPLRQLEDEICWLLGVQFSVGVVPSRTPGQAAAIFGGQFEAVQRQAQKLLSLAWSLQLDRRAETVVLSVAEPGDHVGWEEIGAALAVAQNLVVRDGRIIILSSLAADAGPGLDMLRSSRSPKAALQRMRKEMPPDLLSSTQIASAAAWAHVSLLSRLDSELIEELHLTPLSAPTEAERLIAASEDVVLIDGAEHVWGEIAAE